MKCKIKVLQKIRYKIIIDIDIDTFFINHFQFGDNSPDNSPGDDSPIIRITVQYSLSRNKKTEIIHKETGVKIS